MTTKSEWPSPDNPYRDDMTFVGGGGHACLDGKIYYPSLLRLKLSPYKALDLAEQLISQAKYCMDHDGIVSVDVSGELQKTPEE